MNKAKYTPTPWVSNPKIGFRTVPLENRFFTAASVSEFEEGERRANTEMIVRAVNHHQELLNALKKAIAHHGESHICGTCQEAKALIIRIEGE